MRPTRLAPTVLLFAVLTPSHHGRTRLAAQPRPVARGAIDRPAVDTAPLAAVTTLLDIDHAFSKTGSDLSLRLALDAMFAAGVDSNDAVLMGGPDDPQFVVGSANIARTVAPVNRSARHRYPGRRYGTGGVERRSVRTRRAGATSVCGINCCQTSTE